ncbi:hypothetical protein [Nocardioides antri]|nr:hypothetical protein [Nocardioides antri]
MTVTTTPGSPSTDACVTETCSANRPAMAVSICDRVRATPSAGPRSAVAA